MWNGRDKIQSNRGTARLVVILAVIAVALALVAVVPIVHQISQARLRKVDEEYITTATRMARQEYLADYKGFTMAFDSVNKKFVELSKADEVPDYANAEIHEGQILLVTVTNDGDISVDWKTRDYIEKEVWNAQEANR